MQKPKQKEKAPFFQDKSMEVRKCATCDTKLSKRYPFSGCKSCHEREMLKYHIHHKHLNSLSPVYPLT